MNSTPAVIVICGAPGSGKSTLAREVGKRLALPVINTDDIVEALRVPIIESAGVEDKFAIARRVALYMIRIELTAGRAVVLEAAMPDPNDWLTIIEMTDALAAHMFPFRLYVPFDVLWQRVALRTEERTNHVIKHDEGALRASVDRCELSYAVCGDRMIDLDGTQERELLVTAVTSMFQIDTL